MNRLSSHFLWASAVLILPTLGNARPVHAEEAGVLTFSWQAPSGCPSRDDLRAEIARLLGGEIRVPKGGDIKAVAVVAQAQIWSLAIETELAGQPGRRSIEAASCQDLADATALIIALMIDPNAVAAHAAQPRPVPPPAPSDPAPQKARGVAYLVGIHAAGSYGTLPSIDAGLGGGVGLAGRRWRVELRGTYGLRRDQRVTAPSPAPADSYGRFNFVAAALAGCLNLGRENLAVGPCADAEVGMLSAKGFGVSEGFSTQTLWLALGAGAYAAIPLGPHLSLPLHLDVVAPLLRPEFVFRNVPTRVFRAPVVGGRISAGIEFHF